MKRLLLFLFVTPMDSVAQVHAQEVQAQEHVVHHDKVFSHGDEVRRELGMSSKFFDKDANPLMQKKDGDTDGKGGDDDKCKQCVGGAMKWSIEHMVDGINKYCDDKTLDLTTPIGEEQDAICHQAELGFSGPMGKGHEDKEKELGCDKKKWWCMFWKDDPKVALGFVIAKSRPWETGFAYCVGKGHCEMKDKEKSVSTVSFDALSFDAAKLPQGHELIQQNLQYSAEPSMEISIKRSMLESDSSEEEAEDHKDHDFWVAFKKKWQEKHPGDHDHHDHDHGHGGHVCVKCYKKVFKIVMAHAIGGTKKMCEHTKCPFLQHWCKWAGHNKEMAYGMLLEKVEPWKYAIGRCWHPDGHHGGPHGPGPHGDHHHGDHHHGHHHGHWWWPFGGHHGHHHHHHDHDDHDHHGHHHHDHHHDGPPKWDMEEEHHGPPMHPMGPFQRVFSWLVGMPPPPPHQPFDPDMQLEGSAVLVKEVKSAPPAAPMPKTEEEQVLV